MKRIITVLTIATLMAALIAGPVAAQTEPVRQEFEGPFLFTTLNPCNVEFVEVQGTFKGFLQDTLTPGGTLATKLHATLLGTGIGSQGNHYTFNQTQETAVTVNPSGGAITDTFEQKLISEGPADNFVLNLLFHVSPSGEVRLEQADAQCRG